MISEIMKDTDFRNFENLLADVRKRALDTAGEMEEVKAKVRKLTNLQVVVPAVVNRVERTEKGLAKVAEKQEFRNLI